MAKNQIAEKYYEGFTNGGRWEEVPMAENLRFASPMMNIDGAADFRAALGGLSAQCKGLNMRRQACDGDQVISVYDLDMGGGPIPMAEVLCIEDGMIREVELIFDKSLLIPGDK